jgi:hypothetical protein
MRSAKLFTVSVAASLLLGAVAHASDAPGLPWNLGSFQRVSAVGAQQYPGLHWTSVIGTGTAASLGGGVSSFQGVGLVNAQHDPGSDWTAMIGTGTAASLKR